MGNETDNGLGRACVGYRDAEEVPQPCPTGELPTGARHRCDACHADNSKARKAAKQARYRRRRADALGKFEEALAAAKAARELAKAAAAGANDAQETAAEAVTLIGSFAEQLQEANREREEAQAQAVSMLRAEVNGLVFRLSRLELLAQQPWWRRRSYWRRSQLGAGVSPETDEG